MYRTNVKLQTKAYNEILFHLQLRSFFNPDKKNKYITHITRYMIIFELVLDQLA